MREHDRQAPRDEGLRLAAQEPRLRLLLAHLAGRALRARVELDDLVQEVYLRVLAAPLPSHEPEDPRLWGLLRRVARNAVVDAARAARAQKRDGRLGRLAHSEWSSLGARAPAAPGPGPATLAAAGEEERRLLASFAALSAEHRRVIGLRQLEGLSAREAARRLGRGEAAVHSLYRRALAAWGEALETGMRGESAERRRLDAP